MVTMIATIFIPVFATSLGMLLAGNFINGIPWGGESAHSTEGHSLDMWRLTRSVSDSHHRIRS